MLPPMLASRLARIALLTASLTVLGASIAEADSLVFLKGGEVWISHGDGSDQRQVTGAANNWSWPTEDDAGAILAAGGQGSVNAGVEDTPGSEIYRMDQRGTSLSAPQETPGSLSTTACPTYAPVSLRVAPDGKHFAYHAFVCDQFQVELGTVGGSAFSANDRMDEFVFPYWVSNSEYVMSRGGDPGFDSCDPGNGHYGCVWWAREVGQQVNYGYPWAADPGSSATGFDGLAVSRDGTKFASIEEDAADWFGGAHNVDLRIWSASGTPNASNESVAAPTFKCQLTLPADPETTLWFDNAGPTFSPDGSHLAFAEPDGIHIADVSNLGSCASVSAPLVIPGATQPFWSGAEEAANAGFPKPGSGPGEVRPPSPDRTAPSIRELTVTPRRFQAARGATVHYALSEAAHVSFTAERLTTGRRKGHRCVRPTAALRKSPRCVLSRTAGTLSQTAAAGANSFALTGRFGSRKLAPGRYRLLATPTDHAGNRGATKSAPFVVLAAHHS